MSVEIQEKREHGADSQVEVFVMLCKTVAQLIRILPDEDQADLVELLQVMSRSDEEMEHGIVTLREMLQPKMGTTIPMVHPMTRPKAVQRWADFVGTRVREMRKKADITQEQLADRAGLPQSHISRIENGEVSPTRLTVEKIAAALGVGISDFDPTE